MIQLQLPATFESKAKSGRRPGGRVFEMSCVPMIAVLIAAVLGLGFNNAYGHRLGNQAQAIARRQAGTPDSYKHRMDVIKQLCDHQAPGADFLKDASAVWLKSLRDEGESIAIEGVAINPNAVSEIISDLKSTGYFRNIEIKETYREDSKNKTNAFEFLLTCEFETNRS